MHSYLIGTFSITILIRIKNALASIQCLFTKRHFMSLGKLWSQNLIISHEYLIHSILSIYHLLMNKHPLHVHNEILQKLHPRPLSSCVNPLCIHHVKRCHTWVMFFFSNKSTVWKRSWGGTPSSFAPLRN